jgi:hypothetical protein
MTENSLPSTIPSVLPTRQAAAMVLAELGHSQIENRPL